MGKKLLSKEYDKTVSDSFFLSDKDIYKHYSNFIDEHLQDNPDLFDELLSSIERWREWYMKQVYQSKSDYTWEVDENGNEELIDEYLPLHSYFGKIGHINKQFLDKQIELIRRIRLFKKVDETREKLIQLSKRHRKKPMTFRDLFRDKDNAKRVKELFESHNYTIKGKWQGLTGNKSELLCAYYAFKPLLKAGLKDTPTAKIIYKEFGLPDYYISDRMLRNELFNDSQIEFERLFSDLLK